MLITFSRFTQASQWKLGLIADTHATESYIISTDRMRGYDNVSVPLAISRWNAANIDFAVALGDLIDGELHLPEGQHREVRYARFINDVSTISGYELYLIFGHWDHGWGNAAYCEDCPTVGEASDFTRLFDTETGLGSLIPIIHPPTLNWWPVNAVDNSPCAYVVDSTKGTATIRFIFLHSACIATGGTHWLNEEGQSGDPPQTMDQEDWVLARLTEANSNGYAVVIFTHYPIIQIENLGTETAEELSIHAALKALTIQPLIFQAHNHPQNGVGDYDGVRYFRLHADLEDRCNYIGEDTNRNSSSIVTISFPAYTENSTPKMAYTVNGYGYQTSLDWQDTRVVYLRCEESTGTSGSNTVKNATGTNHLTPSSAVVSSNNGPINADNLYYVNNSISISGGWYANNLTACPVQSLPISVSMWVKGTDSQTAKCLISFSYNSGSPNYLGVFSNGGYAQIKTKGTSSLTNEPSLCGAFPTIKDDVWHHIVVVWVTERLRYLYQDGVLLATYTDFLAMDWMPTMDEWAIGRNEGLATPGQTGWVGLIDKVMVYSGVLTKAEVWEMYKQGKYKFNDLTKERGLKRN